jgi:hypothetical protein
MFVLGMRDDDDRDEDGNGARHAEREHQILDQ